MFLAAGQISCTSWRDLLKLAHRTASGIFQEDSDSFSSGEEEDVLQSRASLLHRQKTGYDRHGYPGLFFRAGSLCPRGLCAGAGTLLPARVCTQPAQEIRTALQGEAVGRRSNPRQGRARSLCCREGAAWVRAAHSSTSSSGLFKMDIKAGVTSKDRCLPFEFSPLGWLSGQRDISRGTF